MGSNPGHNQMVLSVVFFLLHLHFLRDGSIWPVVCPVWSLFKVQHYLAMEKSYRDQLVTSRGDLVTAKGDLSDKNPSSAICGSKTQILVQCLG